ncbi:MAG: TIGR03067 domain-containing protein [Gemmataceae bacterium]|nr:TIGR03067 domain-containing protein [Gemmataceae bacterium]
MRARLLLGSAAVTLLAFAPLPFPSSKKPAGLDGLWDVGPTLRAGGESPPTAKSQLLIEKGKWTFLRDGKPTVSYETTVDDKAAIPTLDLRGVTAGKRPALTYLGIYKLEGDTLLYSYQSPGGAGAARPTGFKPAGPRHLTMKFQRAKEPKR